MTSTHGETIGPKDSAVASSDANSDNKNALLTILIKAKLHNYKGKNPPLNTSKIDVNEFLNALSRPKTIFSNQLTVNWKKSELPLKQKIDKYR